MKTTLFALLVGVLLSCLISSCTSLSDQSWMNPEFAERQLGKTMVMGLGDSKGLVTQYEIMFINGLAMYGLPAQSIHTAFPKTDPYQKTEVIELLETHQFDSLIVTRLLSGDDRQRQGMGSFIPTLNDDAWGNVQVYIFIPNTSYMQNLMEYVLETNLYDVRSKKLVWSGRKSVYDDSSDRTNLKKVIRSVLKELHHNKMLTD